MLPNFLIIGANKSGTTSLYRYLSEHPQIFMSSIKEPMYFKFQSATEEQRLKNIHSKNVGLQTAIYTLDDYRNLFKGSETYSARGEASTTYLANPDISYEIFRLIPNVKLIAILREPISRAISNYKMYVEWGLEKRSFRKAMYDEINGKISNLPQGMHYLKLGLYSNSIQTYMNVFSKDQIRVYFFDDFIRNTNYILSDIYDFLGVNNHYRLKDTKVYHKSKIIPINRFERYINRFVNLMPLNKLINHAFFTYGKPDDNVLRSENLINTLKKYYESDINKLEVLLNKELNDWKSKCKWIF